MRRGKHRTLLPRRTPSILSFIALLLAMLFSRGALTANILAAAASVPRRSVGGAARHHHPPLGRRDDDNSVALLLFRRYSPPPFLGASRAAVANRRSSSLLPPPSSTMQRLRGGGGGLDDDSTAAEQHRRRRGSSSGWRGAYLAVGSNLGDRYRNVADALSALESSGDVRILRTSYLRSTSPMYVTDQPPFLNGAVFVETRLCPIDLLRLLKRVESDLGRDVGGLGFDGGKKTERFGPRTIDLDILLYDGHHRDDDGDAIGDVVVDDGPPPATRRSSLVMRTEELEIPHPRMSEREFVLSPMRDLERSPHSGNDEEDENSIISHPVYNESMSMLLESLMNHRNGENNDGGDDNIDAVVAGGGGENVVGGGGDRAVRVLPLPRGRMLHLNETIIMGILNVTPDSFSDGGEHADSIESAARRAIRLEEDGAGIVDVGGESTRPGADDVPVDVELGRTVPVIRRIRELGSDVAISIDTRSSVVASAAIEAGADVVNDVSGGSHDPGMLGVVASHGVPMIIMHMRGDPRTMTSLSDYDGCPGGVVGGVSSELNARSAEAERAGVHRWLQVIDPGIGFAKDHDGNLSLLGNVDDLRRSCGYLPLLIGPSRKRFVGVITGEVNPADRDYGTIAACLASIRYDDDDGEDDACCILRVHNVRAVKQAVMVYDAIRNARRR